MIQKLSFNSSAKSAGSSQSSLKSSPSTRPILFGTSKTLTSSPLSKRSHKIIVEDDEDDSDYKSPTIKRQKHIPSSSYILSPIFPSSPTLSETTISKDQDAIEEVSLQSNTKVNGKSVPRPSRKPRPSKKVIENAL